MNIRLLLTLLAVALSATWLNAAAADDDEEDYAPELGVYASSKNTTRFGFRMTSGASVDFGNLGTVPLVNLIAAASAGEVDRRYADGAVIKDSLRGVVTGRAEVDANGVPISTPGGRYTTTTTGADGSPSVSGDFLSFTPGLTRNWRYDFASQLNSDASGIIMHAFSASSDGASLAGKSERAAGVELQMERHVGKLGNRWKVSLVGGIALTSINNQRTGNVSSTLNTITDTFLLNGLTAPAVNALGQPTFTNLPRSDGTFVANGLETTVPISSVPVAASHLETSVVGGANVSGVWKISGAYYVMRVGPEFRTNLGKDFALSASMGVAGAYVGTNYSAAESLTVTGIVAPLTTSDSNSVTKFMPGYYANLDALYQLSDRTGFFAGINYEQFGNYSQSVGGRSAKIELAGAAGIRGGITVKF